MQFVVADPGLDHRIGVFFVDLDDTVQPFEIEDDATGLTRRRTTVTKISAGRNRPQRDLVFARYSENALHFPDILGCDRCRRGVRIDRVGRIGIAITAEMLFVVPDQPLRPNDGAQFFARRVKCEHIDSIRQYGCGHLSGAPK